MLKIEAKVTDGVSDALKAFIATLDTDKRTGLNQAAGQAANTEAQQSMHAFNQAGGWRGKRYMTGPGRTQGDFGADLADGWNFRTASKDGATISNGAPYYRFKVTGGTITPRRAKALTIPMLPEAVGRTAKEYETDTGNRLFTIKGKKALFRKDGDSVRVVYALVARVKQDPWPRALPETERLAKAFSETWIERLMRIIRGQ
jgi:hypothetical protein